MTTKEQKISLLLEMIAFAVVDGKLHEKEYQFLSLIAVELGISEKEFEDLFHSELSILPIKSETQRIQQFYRLALLMHIDGILHEKEKKKIKEIALKMGLNPSASNKILKFIEESPSTIIDPNLLFDTFKQYYN